MPLAPSSEHAVDFIVGPCWRIRERCLLAVRAADERRWRSGSRLAQNLAGLT
jgi:hypothetical protein